MEISSFTGQLKIYYIRKKENGEKLISDFSSLNDIFVIIKIAAVSFNGAKQRAFLISVCAVFSCMQNYKSCIYTDKHALSCKQVNVKTLQDGKE